ncbi:MAG TPA: helix-turn-helix transcriptional regulator [Steroidobacteraceae bacterium]|nr:helix-turn-helix transcriptional regulator [Steroidobacteraceae bacterium]
MRDEERIPGIIDDLYAGTLDPLAWRRGLLAMADVVSGSAALLLEFNPRSGRVMRNENHNVDPAVLSQYNDHWCTKDIRREAASRLAVDEPMFTDNVLSRRTFLGSEVYNDFLMPADVPWILSFWLHKACDRALALSIQGTRRRGPFCQADGERIRPLLPHLRRALEIKDRLQVAQVRYDTLTKSFDNLSFGVLILDADGRILEASAVAAEILRAEQGARRNADGTLGLRDPAGAQLNRWILTGSPPAENSDGLLRVPRALARPLSVMLTPLSEMSRPWMSVRCPRWMLLLFDPDRRVAASRERIALDLKISAREAQLAALLAAGYDLRAIAQRMHISVHTARTHLKTIFGKTGLHSQVELVRHIAGGPASVRGVH